MECGCLTTLHPPEQTPPMRTLLAFLLLTLSLLVQPCAAAGQNGHFLYLSLPDGAQPSDDAPGILIFNIDDGHKFVRRIDIPIFKEGLRGFCANAPTHSVYYSTTSRRLGRFDVETEKVVWEKTYGAGCDRASITPDGTKIYVPTGWWLLSPKSGLLVVDAKTGNLIKEVPVNTAAHNSIVSLDGRYAYLGTTTTLTVFNARNDKIVKTIHNVGERGVFPFTVDSRQRYAYVCLGNHVGFDVVDLEAGKPIHRVMAGDKPIGHRTHGAGLTPDETELWISDQEGQKLFIFDATQMPPLETGHVDLSAGGHGWVTFSLDGKYAWCHTSDIFDTKTKQRVATLKDGDGKPVSSSKFVEIQFEQGRVTRVGDQFGLGRVHSPNGGGWRD